MSLAQAAEVWGVTLVRARQFVQEGRIKATKVAGRWLIEEAEVKRFERVARPPGRPPADGRRRKKR